MPHNQAEIENAENVTVDEQGDDDEHIVLAEYLSDDEAKEDEKSDEEDESDDHVTKVWFTGLHVQKAYTSLGTSCHDAYTNYSIVDCSCI